MRGGVFRDRLPQLVQFAGKIVKRHRAAWIIEPNLGRAVLHLLAAHQRRKRRADASKRLGRRFLPFALLLDPIPVNEHISAP